MKIRASEPSIRLARLIKLTRLGRTEFAKKIGIAPVTLDKWKNGEHQFEVNDAKLIARATGIHSDWLMGKIGGSENPLDWHGQPYNVETYKRWDKHQKELTESKPREAMIREMQITQLIYRIVQIVRAAGRRGKYEMFFGRLMPLIESLAAKFNLSDCGLRETIPFLAMGQASINTQFVSQSGKLGSLRMIDAPDVTDTEGYRELLKAGQAHAMKEGIAVAKASYHDPTEIIKMQATLSPLFLFQLGDWAGAEEWDAIRDEIAIARRTLDLLESKLSKK